MKSLNTKEFRKQLKCEFNLKFDSDIENILKNASNEFSREFLGINEDVRKAIKETNYLFDGIAWAYIESEAKSYLAKESAYYKEQYDENRGESMLSERNRYFI